jgi:O-antigen/teichoic acid export membrane protein
MLTLSVLAPGAMLFFLMVNPVYSAREASFYFNISCAATLIAGVYFWMKSSPIAERSVSFSSQKLKQACIPLWFVIILAQVSQWSSQMMLGAWSTADNVAFFAAAQRTAMLTSFVLFAVNSIAAPKFSALYAKGDMAALEKTAIWSVRLMWTIAVPVLLFITLTSEWLMGFFGDEFKEASIALIILAVGQFVNIATGSVGYLLSMTGHERALRNNSIISALLGVALGALLIPDYGLIGASISTAAAIACQNLLGVYQVRKHLGFNMLMIRG